MGSERQRNLPDRLLADRPLDLAWTSLRPGEELGPRAHPTKVVLLVFSGAGEIAGRARKVVAEGDAVVIPAGREYRLTAGGTRGMRLLEIVVASDAAPAPRAARSLAELLARSAIRDKGAVESKLHGLLDRGISNDADERGRLFACLDLVSEMYRSVLFLRQGTCRDHAFGDAFLSELRAEIGHDEGEPSGKRNEAKIEPMLRACSTWFMRQMLVLDNAEKAVLVQLVLRPAMRGLFARARTILANDSGWARFAAVEKHDAPELAPLEGLSESAYQRLSCVLEDGWDMFDAMSSRIAHVLTKSN